jgi:hypothetical protein
MMANPQLAQAGSFESMMTQPNGADKIRVSLLFLLRAKS